jgi:hypothetical protein
LWEAVAGEAVADAVLFCDLAECFGKPKAALPQSATITKLIRIVRHMMRSVRRIPEQLQCKRAGPQIRVPLMIPLCPIIHAIASPLGRRCTGYFSEANVTDESVKDVDLCVATGRDKHGDVVETNSDPPPAGALPKEAMRAKL